MSSARTRDHGQSQNAGKASPRPGEPVPSSAELPSHAELLPLIYENVGDGLIVADERGQVVFFNPAARRILGMNVSDAPMGELSQRFGMFNPVTGQPYPAQDLP